MTKPRLLAASLACLALAGMIACAALGQAQTTGCGWLGLDLCDTIITKPPVHKMISQAPEAGPPLSLSVEIYTLDAVPQCVPCSALGPRSLSMAPDKTWVSATVDLAYAWMRAAVVRGAVPYADGAYVPPSVWTRSYPTINYCTDRFNIAAVSGTWSGTACAHSAAYNDSILVAMEDRSQIKARIGWEACNQVLYYHLHDWTLSDGPQVGSCAAFITANNP